MGNCFKNCANGKLTVVNVKFTEDLKDFTQRTFIKEQHDDNGFNLIDDDDILKNDKNLQNLIDRLTPNCLYCDNEFPPEAKSIWYNTAFGLTIADDTSNVIWKRAKDFVQQPCLIANDITKEDIIQGQLGDCWFLVAAAAIAQQKDLIEKVIPLKQHLFGNDYNGVLMCRFWQFGEWIEIFVDDFLPTETNLPVYARCAKANELWVAYLEKAYAKMYGCYEALEGGNSIDALVDLTGGLAELYDLDSTKYELFDTMLDAYKAKAFMTCSMQPNNGATNTIDANGLVNNHAYTIKGVYKIKTCKTHDFIELVKIRNPWMNQIEWKGSWSDHDPNWKLLVDEKSRQEVSFKANENDGEFFMCYKDFCTHFKDVSICTLGPDFKNNDKKIKSSADYLKLIKGMWIGNKTAGGSRNDILKFAQNPQYLICLKNTDKTISNNEQKTNMIISLMQDYRKSSRNSFNKTLYQIGYLIYKVDSGKQVINHKKLDKIFFENTKEYEKSGVFVNYREITKRLKFNYGYYVIIPCTFAPNQISKFVLRIYSERPIEIIELT